ncbi:hypothetical protein PMAYCL1PPCAC_28278, partial [Pristionchus mayeri]
TRVHQLINKGLAITNYVVYVICNSIFTILTSREMYRMRGMVYNSSANLRIILIQQRNLFIVVSACTISHICKAVHQFAIFISMSLDKIELASALQSWYPLINGFATYAMPICLVLLSPTLRERLLFRKKKVKVHVT